ncbi:hypothetical protein OS493_037047 [Desmophyllum pertusum]|uniref:Uncharacterized protein n=1 Tax=Desmophyllum pertusum TaxID=174260 RepID=A0A9X0D6E3_9CNID|nr:hypothetical protein OS493_037047 [Desmophyllum pertusum]
MNDNYFVENYYFNTMELSIHWSILIKVNLFLLDFRQMSAQTVFSALDYLNRWTRARAHSLAVKTQLVSAKNRAGASGSGIQDKHKAVKRFWKKFLRMSWLMHRFTARHMLGP